MKFINRERELTDLDDLWHRPGAQLVVVNGVSGAFTLIRPDLTIIPQASSEMENRYN